MTTERANISGVDSHKDTIHVAVIDEIGHHLDDHEFPTTVPGYRRAVAWLIEHGPLRAVGVEGTSNYGVGITTALTAAGITVVEVNRTRPAEPRARGKTNGSTPTGLRDRCCPGRRPPIRRTRASNPSGR